MSTGTVTLHSWNDNHHPIPISTSTSISPGNKSVSDTAQLHLSPGIPGSTPNTAYIQGYESDEGEPGMATNYNSRLDVREDYGVSGGRAGQSGRGHVGGRGGRGVRSRAVRARGGDDDEDEGGGW
jgi:hypothetical protein